MAVTRLAQAVQPASPAGATACPTNVAWLLGASLLVAGGLALVYGAKTRDFAETSSRLARGEIVNLNAAPENRSPLPNVGALARLRHISVAALKPTLVVRTPREFHDAFLRWTALYFAGFYLVWLGWRLRRFGGDRAILPALHLLTGIGLILMISLRDPLRDTLEFRKFALGVFLGSLLLLLPLFRFFHYRNFSHWCYTPLFGAVALFGLLFRFGSGPGASDAKVNLGPFQPVEIIKILLALFLAGYFTRQWERLRDLSERLLLRGYFQRRGIPRLAQVLPVLCAIALSLGMLFALKDLGPALVLFFLFLSLYAAARARKGLALAGAVLMFAGVAVGYRMGAPRTVVERIDMWLSPWDNNVRGGGQLAHSIWALSTGGLWGSGPGWGDPDLIPAGHTDLVLPAIGEEWGFAGVAAVFLLFAFLVRRALRIALGARTEYAFFLAFGLACLAAYEMMLISAGVLGVLPLSGVVSPFLSSGNTAMLSNFLVFAILLSISADQPAVETGKAFGRPVRWIGGSMLAFALVLLGFAACYQVARDREYLARDTRVVQEDGVKRAQHNPRIRSLAREIPRGDIFDRNGVLLASSDWNQLERRRAQYEALGVSIDAACSRRDSRQYPFGAATAHLLGDLRTGENFHASNASLVEHDANEELQGYRISELADLVRYRHQPGNSGLKNLLARDRNVRTSIDIRLQLRAERMLAEHLAAAHKERGALVVMDAASGDVLALVSRPEPPAQATPDELLDRARYGQYPPGSTFKLVTAMAALRLDPRLRFRAFSCERLPDGRVGARVRGWNRPIHDDIGDRAHGALPMEKAIAVSCNAYFAQLGVYAVGSRALSETAGLLEIPAGDLPALKLALPFAAYGQGPVLITPFKMARVAAAIAADGRMPQGRWLLDDSNTRRDAPREIVSRDSAAFLAGAMRLVVTTGTARKAMAGAAVSIAGKTGTAQLDSGEPHSWFAGFAPYDGRGRRIAFAVVVEHGGYGGQVAAPVARELVEAAEELGIL